MEDCLCDRIQGGGNGNKAMLRRERNAKDQKKKPGVNQKVAAQKAMNLICQICRTQFMDSSNEATLKAHTDAKHPKDTFEKCFPDWSAPE